MSHQQAVIILNNASTGFLRYIQSLSANHKIREASQDRFIVNRRGPRIERDPIVTGPIVRQVAERVYILEPLKTNDPDSEEDPVVVRIEVEDVNPACIRETMRACFVANTTVTVRHFVEGGIEPDIVLAEADVVLPSSGWLFVDQTIVGPMFDQHRDDAYLELLVTVYGTIRETIDRWYELIGQTPPQLAIDTDLENWLATLPEVGDQADALLSFTIDRRALARAEQRLLDNYIIAYGALALGENRWWAMGDIMAPNGPLTSDYVRFLRGFDHPRDAELFFRSMFAAKLAAVVF